MGRRRCGLRRSVVCVSISPKASSDRKHERMETSPTAVQGSAGVDPAGLSQTRPTPIKRSRPKVKWIVLVLFLTSTLILLVIETYLRLHIPPSTFLINETYTERRHFVPVPDWQGSHYAEPFTVDKQGYRSMPQNGAENDPVVVFIGDSFVFGSGVKDDETIPMFFLTNLKQAGRRDRVINAAFPAYGPFNYRSRFEETIAKENKIDCAFIGLFAGNDFADVYEEQRHRKSLSIARELDIFLLNNIKTYRWLSDWSTQRVESQPAAIEGRLLRLREILRGESDFAKQCINDGLEELLVIQEIADAKHIKVFFFYVPIPQQVTRKANTDGLYLKDVWPADPALLENIPGKMFLDFCANHHMIGIDLSDAFRKSEIPITHFPEEPTNKTVLMPIGTAHLSPEGCRLVSDVLFDLAFRGRDRIQ